jgi:hypothetical protein
MKRDQEREHLDKADRHIAEIRKYIGRQQEFLRRAVQRGRPTESAEAVLRILEQTQRVFERHRELIMDQLRGASTTDMLRLQPFLGFDEAVAQRNPRAEHPQNSCAFS